MLQPAIQSQPRGHNRKTLSRDWCWNRRISFPICSGELLNDFRYKRRLHCSNNGYIYSSLQQFQHKLGHINVTSAWEALTLNVEDSIPPTRSILYSVELNLLMIDYARNWKEKVKVNEIFGVLQDCFNGFLGTKDVRNCAKMVRRLLWRRKLEQLDSFN